MKNDFALGLSQTEFERLEELMSTVMSEWPPELTRHIAIARAKDRGFICGEWYVHQVAEWIKSERNGA